MSQQPLFLLLLLSYLSTVQCWSNGYTQDICDSLTPTDTNPQDSSSPYTLMVIVSRYIIGGEVEGKNEGSISSTRIKDLGVMCKKKIRPPQNYASCFKT